MSRAKQDPLRRSRALSTARMQHPGLVTICWYTRRKLAWLATQKKKKKKKKPPRCTIQSIQSIILAEAPPPRFQVGTAMPSRAYQHSQIMELRPRRRNTRGPESRPWSLAVPPIRRPVAILPCTHAPLDRPIVCVDCQVQRHAGLDDSDIYSL